MRSGIRLVLTLLLITSFILGSASCSPPKSPTAPSSNTEPLNLAVTLDESASVSTLIPQKGGSVNISLNNGLVYTLDIPEGALLSDQEVTLTPIRSIDGLPFSGGLLGGVQMEPDGTLLMELATLTIQVPVGFDTSSLVGFAYHGEGTGFHLAPVSGDGSTITLQIISFSGHGAASGTDQEVNDQAGRSNGSSADDYEQQAAKLLDAARKRGDINDADLSKLIEIWKDYYDKVVKPTLTAAVSDDSKIDSAIFTYLTWARETELLGIESDLASRRKEGDALMIRGLKNAFDQAAHRCVSDQNVKEAGTMITRLSQLALLGDTDSNYTIDAKYKDFERCLTYKVDFDSIISTTTDSNQKINSHVAGTVTLKLDPNNYVLLDIFRGTGELKFKEFTSEFIGESAQLNQLCQTTNLTSEDGNIEMWGKISWKNLNSKEPKVSILLGVKPSVLSQGFPNFGCDNGNGTIQTNFNLDMPLWSSGFDLLHSNIKGSFPELPDGYFFSEFEPGGLKLVGRLVQSSNKSVSGGDLAEDLTIDIFAAPGAK
jgi:hypothetical protein